MAWMNTWPPVKCDRFDGEPEDAYRERADKVTQIVTGFRMGRFAGDIADEMDRLLDQLTDPGRTRRFQVLR